MNKLNIFQISVILCFLFSLGRTCGYPKYYEDKRTASTPGSCVDGPSCIPGFIMEENKTCIDECPEIMYVTSVSEYKYKRCYACSSLHISSDLKFCYDDCLKEIPQDAGRKRCLASPDKCKDQLAQDRTLCGTGICKDIQTPVDFNGVQLCSCPSDKSYYDMITQTCMSTCPSTQYVNEDYKVCLSSDADCKSYMTKTTKICGENVCKSNEYAIPKDYKLYSVCEPCPNVKPIPTSDKTTCTYCLDPQFTNITTGKCLASATECPTNYFIYTNGKSCGPSCDPGDQIVQKNGYKQCVVCNDYVSLDKLSCLKECPLPDIRYSSCLNSYLGCIRGVISEDKKQCMSSCPLGQFKVSTQISPGSNDAYGQCTTCSGDTPYYSDILQACVSKCEDNTGIIDVEAKACIQKSACTKNLSNDSTQCSNTCKTGEFIKIDPSSGLPYNLCVTELPANYYTYTKDSKKYCISTCPQSMIIRESDKTCLLSKTECALVISADSLQCTASCDASKLETAVQMTGYKQCTVCKNLFLELDSTCITTCPDNYVAVFPKNVCLQKGELSDLACSSYKMSVDGKSCDTTCKYPDILVSTSCASPSCTTQGCNFCPQDTYQLFESKQTSCAASCNFYKSSDGLKCVQACKMVFELTSENPKGCIACGGDQTFISSLSGGQCIAKASVTVQNKFDSLSNVLQRTIDNQTVLNSLESSLNDFVASIGESVTSSSNNQDVITKIQNLGTTFVNSIISGLSSGSSSEEAATKPYSFGSKSTVLAVVQKLKSGRKMKSTISLSSILGDTAPDLTETGSGEVLQYDSIASSVIVNNPTCSISDCQFPVVNVQTQQNVGRLRMLSDTAVNVDFPVTKTSQLYVCVSIDLLTNKASTTAFTVPTINGLVVTCAVNGPTSIYLDSTCIYLDKTKCQTAGGSSNNTNNTNNKDDINEDDGLSDGGIAGIVIGCVAFTAIVAAGSFFLYKRLLKKKQESNEHKYIQPQVMSEH